MYLEHKSERHVITQSDFIEPRIAYSHSVYCIYSGTTWSWSQTLQAINTSRPQMLLHCLVKATSNPIYYYTCISLAL